MQCGGKSNFQTIKSEAWRIVEAQHLTSTRKLVDSDSEQKALEEEIESVKPQVPLEPEFQGLHYLLSTPFRYPPLKHGSRFGSRAERALWYGSDSIGTAQAEIAYYRLLFLNGSEAEFSNSEILLTAYNVRVNTKSGINLAIAPFERFSSQISSKTNYEFSQRLGAQMRADGVDAVKYFSARDPKTGLNVALFTPKAFGGNEPQTSQTWKCFASKIRVEFVRNDLLTNQTLSFDSSHFHVKSALPSPAI
jgi:hypothetical protein